MGRFPYPVNDKMRRRGNDPASETTPRRSRATSALDRRGSFSSPGCSATAGTGPTRIALAAGAAADEREVIAGRAWVALVALEPGEADLLLHRVRSRRRRAAGVTVAASVAIAV